MRLALSQLHPRRQIPTTKAAAARMAAKMASGPGVLGAPFPGGPTVGPARAVAVAATASSSLASAVPVAAAAVSISGGNVGVPAGPIGEREGEATAVEVVAVGGVGEVGVEVGLVRAVAVRVAVLVAVAGVTRVGEGPGVGVREAVGVREGVGLGPGVEVDVRVGVLDGVRVALGVELGPTVLVGVRVAVLVAVDVGVAVGREVFVAGGAVTVKVPLLRARGTGFANGSEAMALASDRLDAPGEAPPLTLKETVASVPSGIGKTPPWMTMRSVPAEGCEELNDFPADEAPLPRLTPPTVSRLLSNAISKLMADTSAPFCEVSETATPIPVAPGAPEAEPTERIALGA